MAMDGILGVAVTSAYGGVGTRENFESRAAPWALSKSPTPRRPNPQASVRCLASSNPRGRSLSPNSSRAAPSYSRHQNRSSRPTLPLSLADLLSLGPSSTPSTPPLQRLSKMVIKANRSGGANYKTGYTDVQDHGMVGNCRTGAFKRGRLRPLESLSAGGRGANGGTVARSCSRIDLWDCSSPLLASLRLPKVSPG